MSRTDRAPIANQRRWEQRCRHGGDGWALGRAKARLANQVHPHPLKRAHHAQSAH